MTFSDQLLDFYAELSSDWKLPQGIDIIYPFGNEIVMQCMRAFYGKYYNDQIKRHFLFGINPGRLGAGMTGIPFTDPIHLESHCDIANDIKKKHELSSIFIYKMIDRLGGVDSFYRSFYISSVCPLGFTKEGKNYNYYDDKKLYHSVEKHIIQSITKQSEIYCNRDKAYSLGQGKNFKYLKELNEKHQWFGEIIPLPHPRWVMQYRRKTLDTYLEEYRSKLMS